MKKEIAINTIKSITALINGNHPVITLVNGTVYVVDREIVFNMVTSTAIFETVDL